MEKNLWQRSRDNIVASIIYGMITAFLTIFYEIFIADLGFMEYGFTKLIYLPCRYIIFTFVLDYLMDYFRSMMPKLIADPIALSIYQIPIYIIAAMIMGVSNHTIALIAAIYIADNFAFGWLYGYILDRTRKFFYNKL